MMFPRQRKQAVFAGFLGVMAIVNLLFFAILYQPTRSEYSRLVDSIGKLQKEITSQQNAIISAEKISVQLGHSVEDRTELFTGHFVTREAGYSALMPMLESIAQKSGVKTTRINFSNDPLPKYGLETVGIKIPVEGGYANIVSFLQDLEHADTFFIVDSIDLRSGEGPAPPGGAAGLALTLGLETFFYQ